MSMFLPSRKQFSTKRITDTTKQRLEVALSGTPASYYQSQPKSVFFFNAGWSTNNVSPVSRKSTCINSQNNHSKLYFFKPEILFQKFRTASFILNNQIIFIL